MPRDALPSSSSQPDNRENNIRTVIFRDVYDKVIKYFFLHLHEHLTQNNMEQKNPEELHKELEAEIAANEAAEKAYRRKLTRNLIIIGAIFVAIIGGYFIFHKDSEPEIYYTDGAIDYVKQADKLRRTSGFKSVEPFHAGYAVVSDGKKYGIVDVKGTVICPVKYDAIESSYDQHYPNMCEVSINGKLGLVDKQGKEVVKPIYDDIGPISNSRMQVTVGEEEFYIDTDGNRVEP